MPVIKGIDVSNHQDRIDWSRVRADGIAFAYVKASEGTTFADPKYAAHVTGAKAARIRTGAYHFARPDTRSSDPARDARAEADWFLSLARPRSGDLVPALDLETAGLAPAAMVEWARAWLDHVRAATGVRPIVYTYPAFWSALGGTTAFRLYPLWIANYEVSEPQLPAGWRRYAIWQYSASGSVDGIPGRTDLNRLADGVSLADITYRPGRRKRRVREQNLPGPVPKPIWFWPWLRWRLGVGEFVGLGMNERVRPDEAPAEIPSWAFECVEKLAAERTR
ncbi:MAG TPA: glycoside hydrolase family 25 protein [Candidatus Limnocylindrales bacterium]|nr:glycoside hydrolase family 25 protein [Candidatus Limnocylindrales bacterium]